MARAQRMAPEREAMTMLDRRTFIVSGAFALATFGAARWLVASAQAADTDDFHKLSMFLTGAGDLDPAIAARAFGQLTELDPTFPDKVSTLSDVVVSSQAPSIDDFLAHPASSGTRLRATMVTIVSAWTLGYTGTPIPLRAEDDTGFVTFLGALQFHPTMDATLRPTYARDGLNYWVEPPPFVDPPSMPAHIRAWGQESPRGIGAIPQAPAELPQAPGVEPPPAAQQQE